MTYTMPMSHHKLRATLAATAFVGACGPIAPNDTTSTTDSSSTGDTGYQS